MKYQRIKFRANFPDEYLYTPGHFWIQPLDDSKYRVGLSKFATRMLGEPVECDFEVQPGQEVSEGQTLGWIEGLKASSDFFSVGAGVFIGHNSELGLSMESIKNSPHSKGWLYEIQGPISDKAMDVKAYAQFLDTHIDKMSDLG